MKDFNKKSNLSKQLPEFIPYNKSTGELRKRMNNAIKIIATSPWEFQSIKSFGAVPLEKFEKIDREYSQCKTKHDQKEEKEFIAKLYEALEDMNTYLAAGVKVIELYDTHYEPMTRDGCINIGEIRRDDFKNRLSLLKEAAQKGEKLLLSLDKRDDTFSEKPPKPPGPSQ